MIKRGIRVKAVAPGISDSIAAQRRPDPGEPDALWRPGTDREAGIAGGIAPLYMHLAPIQASYATGSCPARPGGGAAIATTYWLQRSITRESISESPAWQQAPAVGRQMLFGAVSCGVIRRPVASGSFVVAQINVARLRCGSAATFSVACELTIPTIALCQAAQQMPGVRVELAFSRANCRRTVRPRQHPFLQSQAN
jgi:hypothetical protein